MSKRFITMAVLMVILFIGAAFAQGFASEVTTQVSKSWFSLDATALALIGVAIAVVFAGIGSAIGIGISANMALGAMHEHPKLFPQFLLLTALPGTQGIYAHNVYSGESCHPFRNRWQVWSGIYSIDISN